MRRRLERSENAFHGGGRALQALEETRFRLVRMSEPQGGEGDVKLDGGASGKLALEPEESLSDGPLVAGKELERGAQHLGRFLVLLRFAVQHAEQQRVLAVEGGSLLAFRGEIARARLAALQELGHEGFGGGAGEMGDGLEISGLELHVDDEGADERASRARERAPGALHDLVAPRAVPPVRVLQEVGRLRIVRELEGGLNRLHREVVVVRPLFESLERVLARLRELASLAVLQHSLEGPFLREEDRTRHHFTDVRHSYTDAIESKISSAKCVPFAGGGAGFFNR